MKLGSRTPPLQYHHRSTKKCVPWTRKKDDNHKHNPLTIQYVYVPHQESKSCWPIALRYITLKDAGQRFLTSLARRDENNDGRFKDARQGAMMKSRQQKSRCPKSRDKNHLAHNPGDEITPPRILGTRITRDNNHPRHNHAGKKITPFFFAFPMMCSIEKRKSRLKVESSSYPLGL